MNKTIRTAVMEDLESIAAIENASFSAAEAASADVMAERLKYFAGHFWLMLDGGRAVAFLDGFTTDEADLTDEMYARPDMHDETGRWQMIFGFAAIPEYRGSGCAAELMRYVINDVKSQGRTGLVLACKEKLVDYYAQFGFVDEGKSDKSCHGGAEWNQMRLTF